MLLTAGLISMYKTLARDAALAQLVEQWIENPCVPSSILGGGTTRKIKKDWYTFNPLDNLKLSLN